MYVCHTRDSLIGSVLKRPVLDSKRIVPPCPDSFPCSSAHEIWVLGNTLHGGHRAQGVWRREMLEFRVRVERFRTCADRYDVMGYIWARVYFKGKRDDGKAKRGACSKIPVVSTNFAG